MSVVVVLLLALVALGIVVALFSHFRHDSDADAVVVSASSCSTCDGSNSKCEQECMMEAATKPIEYYDDEELDLFTGRSSSSYTDEEAEQFRDILYTMRQEEVAGWSRSLTLRGISVPDQVKDELVMLIAG